MQCQYTLNQLGSPPTVICPTLLTYLSGHPPWWDHDGKFRASPHILKTSATNTPRRNGRQSCSPSQPTPPVSDAHYPPAAATSDSFAVNSSRDAERAHTPNPGCKSFYGTTPFGSISHKLLSQLESPWDTHWRQVLTSQSKYDSSLNMQSSHQYPDAWASWERKEGDDNLIPSFSSLCPALKFFLQSQ